MPTDRDYAKNSTQHALEYTFRAFTATPAARKHLAVQAGLGVASTAFIAIQHARNKAAGQ